jgi:hypothetical protein
VYMLVFCLCLFFFSFSFSLSLTYSQTHKTSRQNIKQGNYIAASTGFRINLVKRMTLRFPFSNPSF